MAHETNDVQWRYLQNDRLAAILDFSESGFNFTLALNIKSKLDKDITGVYGYKPDDF